ncbi:MAG TPA: amylo-alpha-1,6-glucosidase [Anaerolineae bacterium]|nr:amylo-alpha-1,6-glucosidase [Anaerolineae bacterium]
MTPRIGEPVEVSALWHNALCIMSDLARLPEEDRRKSRPSPSRGHVRFWNEETGYCL